MKYKGIIFDLDGVICLTDQFHYQAWKQLAAELGVYFDENINNRLRGVSRNESLEIILEQFNENISTEEKEVLLAKKNRWYVGQLEKMSPADLPIDVTMTLQELRQKGYLLAIGSSSKNARLILNKIGVNDYFDAVSDGSNISKSKPDPEVFLKAAEYLQCPPADCLVVEDAKAGIEAAARGGFDSAGIGEAATCEKTTYRIGSLKDLLSIVN